MLINVVTCNKAITTFIWWTRGVDMERASTIIRIRFVRWMHSSCDHYLSLSLSSVSLLTFATILCIIYLTMWTFLHNGCSLYRILRNSGVRTIRERKKWLCLQNYFSTTIILNDGFLQKYDTLSNSKQHFQQRMNFS